MTQIDELQWLAERRHSIPLHETTTLQARAALEREMAPPPRSRRIRPVRLGAGALVAAAIAVGVVLTTGGTDLPRGGHGVSTASAAPLKRLTNRLHAGATTALPGDATLIIRHQRYPDDAPIDGADLFGDDGSYYYAETPQGLARAIADQKADTTPADDWDFIRRDVAAAESAFDGPIDQARQRMADAAYIPGQKPSAADAAGAPARIGREKGVTIRPISEKAQLENRIWVNGMDALNAGAARPAVRAGVLRLFGTLDSVTVLPATEAGRQVLTLTAVDPGGYTERLTVDAANGMPIRFSGGDAGRPPSVTVTYDVSRVTLAEVAGE